MKKFIITILALVYITTSTGAIIHMHYCMGKLVDWGMSYANNSKCNNCGMEKSHESLDNGCCKDEFKQVQNDNVQKLSESFIPINKKAEIAPNHFLVYSIAVPPVLSNDPKVNPPPRSCKTSIYITNCVFLI